MAAESMDTKQDAEPTFKEQKEPVTKAKQEEQQIDVQPNQSVAVGISGSSLKWQAWKKEQSQKRWEILQRHPGFHMVSSLPKKINATEGKINGPTIHAIGSRFHAHQEWKEVHAQLKASTEATSLGFPWNPQVSMRLMEHINQLIQEWREVNYKVTRTEREIQHELVKLPARNHVRLGTLNDCMDQYLQQRRSIQKELAMIRDIVDSFVEQLRRTPETSAHAWATDALVQTHLACHAVLGTKM